MRTKLRYGMVGAGRVAQSYAQAFEDCEDATLIAVADTRIDAARRLAETLACRSYSTHLEMANDCQLDAVIICTPPVTHATIAIDLLNSKVAVLCEKPLSVDLKTAIDMYVAARKNGVELTMASKFRYVEAIITAKRMIDSGAIGNIVLCENVFSSYVDMTSRWNSKPEISGGGVLIDSGTHSVDLLRYFLGPLTDVRAWEGERSQGLPVEETVSVGVRGGCGAVGSVDLSWSVTKHRCSYLDIYGTDGAISIGWKQSTLFDNAGRTVMVFGPGYDRIQAFRKHINSFSRAVRGNESLLVSEEDALASVSVIEGAYQALRQSRWVPVRPVSRPACMDMAFPMNGTCA